MAGALGVLATILYVPPVRDLFRMSRPHAADALVIVVAAIGALIWMETVKRGLGRSRPSKRPSVVEHIDESAITPSSDTAELSDANWPEQDGARILQTVTFPHWAATSDFDRVHDRSVSLHDPLRSSTDRARSVMPPPEVTMTTGFPLRSPRRSR